MKPLEGLRVLDFAQFLAGPAAALRLADLGAEVIKVERPNGGDLCRGLVVADQMLDGDSLLFHTINRNKSGVSADLKDPVDLQRVKKLIATADVMIHNFRPGVMEKIGLDFQTVKALNPRIIYASVTGYGSKGPWVKKPGQDLLVQSLTGMPWLSGDSDQGPVPVAFAVLDITCGNHLSQGIMAALLRRSLTGQGALVEVDLMSSSLDMQFEMITSYLAGAPTQPERCAVANAGVNSTAPYGIYKVRDGHIAIAMAPISKLADLLNSPTLAAFGDPLIAFTKRDEIKAVLRDFLLPKSARELLDVLEPADIWCAEVLDWPRMMEEEGFKSLDALQSVTSHGGTQMQTTRCPIRIDGEVLTSTKGAPALGADNAEYFTD
ncbi:CaiB/BaiF CoA transferase family protein [Falsihalocynthiibacter arcticus]|uniref:Acyl-CoA transferase n=1 Tax=Falsihalocynthiibacter arcticus TaxID=1579316 RepID=A0A126V1Q7_9RHOB|nr:CoA transferase [Falsihalocynthiibacter arcticus]AML52262.1 hypothetical protein RC74_14155 [Falsihalocynthiibacter arcticus]